ncbi:MAG TPA: nicotinate (nicotinamide) nucleotide adenylyltransferase [Bacteroidales bacterium]|nr:nicotinate (nicotinamide) nucleotide adenylyltransferase [Bacteroidales bacterium]HRZ77011.1 nicotinate (nicotinamide) nucleotide adenylyltransferase [Bacteroidales bacterium]
MNLNKKTGLFFGSFNPVHTGHMILAHYMVEFAGLDQVWFILSPQSPFKKRQNLLDDHHRLALVKEAVDDDPRFRAMDIEFKLPRPSYTIHTLAYLREQYPVKDFALIMGSDILPTFHKWKNYEQILEDYDLYVYPRPGFTANPYAGHPRVHLIDGVPLIQISSSFIRESIGNGHDMRYFLPERVNTYIREMHFYEG